MNYKLELNKQEANPNLIFNNIIFDFLKINIVERYSKPIKSNSSADFIIFKTSSPINNINIITKYILVLDTKLSNTFLLLFSDIVSPFIPL